MESAKLLVDGKWIDATSGKTFPCVNPATRQPVAAVAAGDAADIDRAVAAARRALIGPWGVMKPSERGRLLGLVADLVESHAEELARMDTEDMGRPIRDSLQETRASVPELLRFFAGAADKLRGHTLPVGSDLFAYTSREPWGVVGAITPWNYPLSNAVLKLAPVLACGNTIVLKPAEQSPRSALALGRLCLEAGIPDGVVNVVPGYGPTAGAAVARHTDIDKVTFTGSTEVGRMVLEMAARSNLKPVTLELGGKSPNIVFADADLERAVDAAALSVFFNQGQTCSAATRLIVEDRVAARFVEALVTKARRITVGDPMSVETQMGALASREQFEKVQRYIEVGVDQGATLVTGGLPSGDSVLAGGYFVLPTVFTDVDASMTIAREEILRPRPLRHALS